MGINVNITANLPGAHQEPSIAVNQLNPKIMAVVATDTGTGVARTGLYRSTDGGLTWITGLLPLPAGFGGAEAASIDYTFPNRFIVIVHAFNNFADGSIFVYVSDDNGVTWTDPIVVAQGFGFDLHNDEPYIAFDRTSASPYRGYAYATYTPLYDIEYSVGNSGIFFRRSVDGGFNWLTPIRISSVRGYTDRASIAVGVSGEVYVGYIRTGPTMPQFFVRISYDGGATFFPDPTFRGAIGISSVVLPPTPLPVPGYQFRVLTIASLAADVSATPTAGNVYAAWQDFRKGYSEILFCRSPDGQLWSEPVTISHGVPFSQSFQPSITVAPATGKIYCIYYTNVSNGFLLDCYVAESTDGGNSFINRRVSLQSFNPVIAPPINLLADYITARTTAPETLAAVWTDTRTGKQDVFFGT
ncbi:hypothetical protein SY83_03300 [Paenibacillus swuensis]|uniref:Exo-alpha-sialidase n=1 Tax=Paenibacillus swuensis TaxID=1178515 RepID=A0A172TEL4_9BACL|nr:sialidase family protein [Paenibacillus swuensis]ANE45505.1 hypothetical protein SY83_03300 [Paenibacillus swuensis]